MKITKYVHACLLVEDEHGVTLLDPGIYSYNSGLIDIDALPAISTVVITHEHVDHFYMPFVEALIAHSPELVILTTESIATQLQGKVSVTVNTESFGPFELFESTHEPLPMGNAPENIGVHYASVLTHPGDSHGFSISKRVLAMPMTAPWGSMTNAVKRIIDLRPSIVIPIHDWHWRPEALANMYAGIKTVLEDEHIDFKIPVNGEPIEL